MSLRKLSHVRGYGRFMVVQPCITQERCRNVARKYGENIHAFNSSKSSVPNDDTAEAQMGAESATSKRQPIRMTPLPRRVTFCELCGTGDGIIECPKCLGEGQVLTRVGGAGVAGERGWARCSLCVGQVRKSFLTETSVMMGTGIYIRT